MWSCSEQTVAPVLETYQAAGALLANTLRVMLAAQCALLDPGQWPRDRGAEVLADPNFDFVVVGAGAAGAVVANRLSEVPHWRVLLVEAGGDPTLNTEVPAFLYNNLATSNDWGYRTQPEKNACRGFIDNRCYWPRAKVLGGCTSINAMFYIRGNREDYNEWAQNGNTGWEYENVVEYFKKSQHISSKNIKAEDLKEYHGERGYLNTEIDGEEAEVEDAFIEGNIELGLPLNYDFNGKTQIGVGTGFSTTKDRIRLSTARAFLSPVRHRDNLYVLKNTLATKLIFNKDSKKVKGIEIMREDKLYNIKVNKEVVMSGGAINTPQLLLLSGIGPRNDLKKLNIDVIADLPVGENLQDHLFVPIYYTYPSIDITAEDLAKGLADYLIKKEGPFVSMKPSRIVNFINTEDSQSSMPNIQQHYIIYDYLVNDYLRKNNFKEEVAGLVKELNKNKTIITIYNILLKPKSSGFIKLNTTNPKDHPLIYANYFDKSDDLDISVSGMRHAMRLEKTKAFKNFGLKLEWIDIKACRGLDRESDEFLKCWASEMSTTLFHPCGTAKMGPAGDSSAVVDPQLKVHGIDGLRVADTSIMPSIISGNTAAPAVMIGEKVSNMIKEFWSIRKEEL